MVILLLATVLSALLGEIFDAGLILIIVLLSAGLGFLQEYRAEKTFKALKHLFSPMVTVLRNRLEEEIPSDQVVPGDILRLETGDRVPADARVLEVKSLRVDEASLTGESAPVEKVPGVLPPNTLLSERTNMLFAGTTIAYGRGTAAVVTTGMNTHLGTIAREVDTIKAERTPLELRTAEIGKRLGVAALLICFGVAALSVMRQAANFATIIKAVERGRWIYDNIKKYLTALLSANFVEVLVLGGVVVVNGPAYLPLLPPAILYINFVTDGLPALALGVSPIEPDAMKLPPRDPKESFFSINVLTFIGLSLLILGLILFYVFFNAPDIERGRTEVFFLMILGELVIALNLRSLRYSIFSVPPHLPLIFSVIGSIVFTFLIVELPQVREAFGIRQPLISSIASVMAVVLGLTSAFEGTKFCLKRMSKRHLTRQPPIGRG